MSTLKTTNLQHASAASPAIVLASDGTATAQLSSLNGGALSGARNRIINGDMRIDQRNAGALVTAALGYPVDRFFVQTGSDAAFSYQRDTNAPTGFSNSLKVTTTTADSSLTSGQYNRVVHNIEGFNTQDFLYGTASAKTVTLSFWVRSSITGTHGGSFRNNAGDRSYPFSYSILAANTWEYKTITITGETTGTWLTDNGKGLEINWGLGTASDMSGTAGAWGSATYLSATGATGIAGTLNATWYLSGVQCELGSVATPFERRSYGQELALCQRYFQKSYRPSTAPGASTFDGMEWTNGANARISNTTRFAVQMRTSTTIVPYDSAGTANRVRTSAGDGQTGYAVRGTTENNFTVDYTSGGITELLYHWTASSEL
jgi:hypothetical protein